MQKLWLVACASVLPTFSVAQTGTPAPAPTTPPATNAGSWFYSGPMLLDEALSPIFWRGISIQPNVNHTISRSSGRPGQRSSQGRTTINRFSPGVDLALGSAWKFSYTPTWTWYTSKAYADSLSHSAALSGQKAIGRGEISIRQRFSKSEESLIETGRQTEQETWSTSLSYGAPISSRLAFIVDGTQDLRYTNAFTDTRDHSATASLRYEISPGLRTGVSATWGYSDVDPGANTRWNRVQGTFSWTPGRRLSLSANFGFEQRKLLTTPASTSDGPSYGLNGTYLITETTTLIAGASRGLSSSFYANSVVNTESRYIGITQRLLGKLIFSARYREGKSNYEGIGSIAARSDDTQATTLDLSAPVGSKLSVSAFYQNTENDSNDNLFSLNTEEYGARISYRF